MTKQTPVRIVCPKCGSENVHKDAAAAWCAETQEWTLSSVHDSETCNDCGAEGDFFADRRPIEAPAEPAKQSGEIELGGKLKFRWMIQGDRTPEIYGWLERDYSIVKGTGGFWRTADPAEALARCKAAFPAELGDGTCPHCGDDRPAGPATSGTWTCGGCNALVEEHAA